MNQPRAIAMMEHHGLPTLLATHPNHFTYATNYGGHTPRLYEDQRVFGLLTPDMGRAALLAPIGEAPYLAERGEEVWVPEIWTYGASKINVPDELVPDADEEKLIAILRDKGRNADSLPELLGRVLDSRGLGRAKIGLDERGVNVEVHQKIVEACPGVKFTPRGRFSGKSS